MDEKTYERLLALNPGILEEAKGVAQRAMAAMPDDLRPEEEPAHVYQADASQASRNGGLNDE